jgi:hypothetical protein
MDWLHFDFFLNLMLLRLNVLLHRVWVLMVSGRCSEVVTVWLGGCLESWLLLVLDRHGSFFVYEGFLHFGRCYFVHRYFFRLFIGGVQRHLLSWVVLFHLLLEDLLNLLLLLLLLLLLCRAHAILGTRPLSNELRALLLVLNHRGSSLSQFYRAATAQVTVLILSQ